MLERLARIAAIANSPKVSESDVLSAVELIRQAVGAEEAYLVRAGEPHFLRLGSETPPTEYDIKQRGYWLLWQALANDPSSASVIARIENRLVMSTAPLDPSAVGNYVATLLPDQESNSDMLILRLDPPRALDRERIVYLEAMRPSMSRLTGRLLDRDRQARHHAQLAALADVSRAFNTSHEMGTQLAELATAVAKVSGFDWVNVNAYNDEMEVVESSSNLARYSDTDLFQMAVDGRMQGLVDDFARADFNEVMARGEAMLDSNVFSERSSTPPGLKAYFQRAHITSVGWFPLIFQEKLVGTLIFSSSARREFDEETVSFLWDLTAQAATAVQGMRLYRDLEQKKLELEAVNQVEHFLARTDSLTGLPNRRYLEEVLHAELAPGKHHDTLSVVMVDLDFFKAINDGYGHPVGDEALKFVAKMGRESARLSDFLGRWGGDEFLFVLPGTGAWDAFRLADHFRRRLADVPFVDAGCGIERHIEMTAGVAEAIGGEDVSPLIRRADKALYEAKANGRNQVRIWREVRGAA